MHARRPAALLLENVPALTQVDGGRAFETVLCELAAAGYSVCWKVLDAAPWVAQHRERLFLVGVRADLLPLAAPVPAAAVPESLTEDDGYSGWEGPREGGTRPPGFEWPRAAPGGQRPTARDVLEDFVPAPALDRAFELPAADAGDATDGVLQLRRSLDRFALTAVQWGKILRREAGAAVDGPALQWAATDRAEGCSGRAVGR